MIVNTKTGLLISGELIKDAETRQAGQRSVIKLHVRYGYDPPAEAGGRKSGKLLDVDVWSDIDAMDGMLCKGDAVVVSAQQVKSREYNGKTYYSVDADGLYPSAAVVLRWMQQVIDLTHDETEAIYATIEKYKPLLDRLDGFERADGVPSPDGFAEQPTPQQTTMAHDAQRQDARPAQQIPSVPSGGARDAENAQAETPGSLAGHELYDGEQLSDYAPPWDARRRIPVPNNTAAAEPPIDNAEDLPF